MTEQFEQRSYRGLQHLEAWLYWIDTDGLKIGMTMPALSWISLLMLLWFVPVSLALLLLGHVSLSILLALGEMALLNLFYTIEVPSRSPAFFLFSLLSIILPLLGIACIIWGHLSVGGVALLLAMGFRWLSYIHKQRAHGNRYSLLVEAVATLLALGALLQVTLPLFGNSLQIITILLSIIFLPLTPRPGDWPQERSGFYEVDAQGRPVRFLTNKLDLRLLSWPMLRPRFLRSVRPS